MLLCSLVSPEGSLMFWEGGARQVWCKKEEVVGGLTVIQVQHQLLGGHLGAAGDRRGDNGKFASLKAKCG